MLDALEANFGQDYRKALLYAAIATEAFARGQIENAMASVIAARALQHRVVSFALPGGGRTDKDPVYEVLASSDSFSRLLHEQSLYVLGRSLLIDAPDLYKEALRLYGTRNKIAHLGATPPDDKYFQATRDDALEGLATAVQVLEWFGDSGPYCIDDRLTAVEPMEG